MTNMEMILAIMTDKNILIVGAGNWYWYQPALYDALIRCGAHADTVYSRLFIQPTNLYRKIKNHFSFGREITAYNNEICQRISKNNIDVLFVYNCRHISSKTLKFAKKNNCRIAFYYNDNPFSKCASRVYWRRFKPCLKYVDHAFCYRPSNFDDYKRHRVAHTSLLRSSYIPSIDKPLFTDEKKYKSDVIFIGHYENDDRLDVLERLLQSNLNMKIYGGGWKGAQKHLAKSHPLLANHDIDICLNDEYRKLITNSKVALCFFSKINEDVYTRRVFEILACGTVLACESSNDVANMFEEGTEFVPFKGPEDAYLKISNLVRNSVSRDLVATRGNLKLKSERHSIDDRANNVMEVLFGKA